ncbi:cadherin-related family member 5 isoform X1 [Leuresthes tenuis]|uniref:cadherin-related family member 5 isoform X1 n=1 Tax=Leuresthes tenuis TaxID=355514 RepID=UPI003B51110A
MERIYPHFAVSKFFSLLLLILLQTSTATGQICSAPSPVNFPENNTVNVVVATISVENGGVTLMIESPLEGPFRIQGNQLIVTEVLDYEIQTNYVVRIICKDVAENQLSLSIIILVENKNDNPPVFDQNQYSVSINEMSPVDTPVGRFDATDRDQHPQLFYTLTSETNDFQLKSPAVPEILVKARLDYDKVKNVQVVLTVQDTAFTEPPSVISFTASTTIMITILDVDNRPPWFQPCNQHDVDGTLICESTGYTGRVILNEQESGALPLKPGPLHAIDGDIGINEEIKYSFLRGNDDGLFAINQKTGNITMLKPTDVLGTISLTVLAAQSINSHQFATTTVMISVEVKSLHPPQFQRLQYEALVTSVGNMAMDLKNTDEPLQILATDEDYAATGGLNPHITYSIDGNSDFSIIGGFLFMTRDLPEASLSLQVLAQDATNDERATAQLIVEVKSRLSTTSLPMNTTDIITTSSMEESTTYSMTTTNPSMSTSESTFSSTTSSMSTEGDSPTTNSAWSTDGSFSTARTSHPVIAPSSEYGVVEMAALGATLGVLLFVCLVVIGLLVHRMKKGKGDWMKSYEASVFRSSLGKGGDKEVIQYTNEAFQRDEDRGSMGSSGPEAGSIKVGGEPPKLAWDVSSKEAIQKSSTAIDTLVPDNASDTNSDKTDNEKEVKPILTKERRVEEGYKSVWFKEDIDPNSKEEVVIIPDSGEDESEEEEPSSRNRQDDAGNLQRKTPKVLFAETDLDSGIGVKFEDPAEDLERDNELNVDL